MGKVRNAFAQRNDLLRNDFLISLSLDLSLSLSLFLSSSHSLDAHLSGGVEAFNNILRRSKEEEERGGMSEGLCCYSSANLTFILAPSTHIPCPPATNRAAKSSTFRSESYICKRVSEQLSERVSERVSEASSRIMNGIE